MVVKSSPGVQSGGGFVNVSRTRSHLHVIVCETERLAYGYMGNMNAVDPYCMYREQ